MDTLHKCVQYFPVPVCHNVRIKRCKIYKDEGFHRFCARKNECCCDLKVCQIVTQEGTKMRILYIDLDSQRPDHLGCYGYHRNTSPNVDAIAAQGVRFDNVHVSDAPCLPSRTALWSGRHGIHTGVINHGGVAADPFLEGEGRKFRSMWGQTNWMTCLRNAKHHTATISPFGERHSAWHWYAGFNEIFNTGKSGQETADEVAPVALDWINKNARRDDWFLHVNFLGRAHAVSHARILWRPVCKRTASRVADRGGTANPLGGHRPPFGPRNPRLRYRGHLRRNPSPAAPAGRQHGGRAGDV